jgi:hypothetical protein
MMRYTAEVKALLRAAGMSDSDIAKAESRADQNLLRFIAAIYPRPACPTELELRRLEEKVGAKVVELMGLKRPLGQTPLG